MEGKKAQNITVSTIIIIVLALVVLVVLIIGFTSGWGNLWETITGIFPSSSNVEKVVKSCQVACTTNSVYDYCSLKRTIRWQETEKIVATTTVGTCDLLENHMSVATTDKSNKNLPTTALTCDIDCSAANAAAAAAATLKCTDLKSPTNVAGEWTLVDKGKSCPTKKEDRTTGVGDNSDTPSLTDATKEYICCVPTA